MPWIMRQTDRARTLPAHYHSATTPASDTNERPPCSRPVLTLLDRVEHVRLTCTPVILLRAIQGRRLPNHGGAKGAGQATDSVVLGVLITELLPRLTACTQSCVLLGVTTEFAGAPRPTVATVRPVSRFSRCSQSGYRWKK